MATKIVLGINIRKLEKWLFIDHFWGSLAVFNIACVAVLLIPMPIDFLKITFPIILAIYFGERADMRRFNKWLS